MGQRKYQNIYCDSFGDLYWRLLHLCSCRMRVNYCRRPASVQAIVPIGVSLVAQTGGRRRGEAWTESRIFCFTVPKKAGRRTRSECRQPKARRHKSDLEYQRTKRRQSKSQKHLSTTSTGVKRTTANSSTAETWQLSTPNTR